MNKMFKKTHSGFTLVEVVIVMGLGVLIIMSITSLFILSLSSRAKGNIARTLKEEGTQAMNQMQFLIRNAQPLTDCEDVISHPEYLDIVSKDKGETRLKAATATTARIASNSAYLTSSAVTVANEAGINTLQFTCDQGFEGAGQYVSIQFTLSKAVEGSATPLTETFTGGAQIRNATGTQ